MAKPDSYVKRFKSLSLSTLVLTLLAYDLFQFSAGLGADFLRSERLFFAIQLTEATVPANSEIQTVGDQSAVVWREAANIDPLPPKRGRLIDLVRLWDPVDLEISGTLSLTNGEILHFKRKPSLPSCSEIDGVLCQPYKLSASGQSTIHTVDLAFVTDSRKAGGMNDQWYVIGEDDEALVSPGELGSDVVASASRWVSSPDDAEAAYFAMRDKLERRTVRLPFVGLDVPVAKAASFLGLIAVSVAALMAHALLAISGTPARNIDEPWIVLRAAPASTVWLSKAQTLISGAGCIAAMILIWCPVLVMALAILLSSGGGVTTMLGVLLVIGAGLAVVSSASFIRVAKSAFTINHVEEPAT